MPQHRLITANVGGESREQVAWVGGWWSSRDDGNGACHIQCVWPGVNRVPARRPRAPHAGQGAAHDGGEHGGTWARVSGMISTRLAWMAPVPGSMGGHVMTPISDERSSRMWWLPLGVYVPGGLGGLGKPAWWHGTLAASEPGEGRGADGRFNVMDDGPGLACPVPPSLPRTRHEERNGGKQAPQWKGEGGQRVI